MDSNSGERVWQSDRNAAKGPVDYTGKKSRAASVNTMKPDIGDFTLRE